MSIAITATCAALLALLTIVLGGRVVILRRRYGVGVGDGGHKELMLAIRAHGNLLEQAPLALVLLLLLELAGASTNLLLLLAGLLVLGRLLHAWGLSHKQGISFGRFYGTAMTWGMMLITSIALLAKPFIG